MGISLKSAVGAVLLVVAAIATFSLVPQAEFRALALLGLGYLSLCLATGGKDPTERRARRIAQQTECPLPIARARAVAELGVAL